LEKGVIDVLIEEAVVIDLGHRFRRFVFLWFMHLYALLLTYVLHEFNNIHYIVGKFEIVSIFIRKIVRFNKSGVSIFRDV
jgi:hypothetical protein